MFRALLWKEWRQLALVRWGGFALGALLPVAFMAGAELAHRGLLPTGTVKAYSTRDVMFELLPAALGLGLWPLIGLMAAAQAFAGDRAAGTESFLLERPVPRGLVWSARCAASLLSVTVLVAGTTAIAAMAGALTGAPPGIGWSRWLLLAGVGAGVGLLALLGALIAASLLTSPMGSVLLGALMGAFPAVVAAQLVSAFSYARFGGVFVGAVVPALLLPAYVAASWLAFCRGEPAGGGRVRRALTLLAATLVGVVVVFLISAPLVVRASAASGQHSVAVARSGGTAFVTSVGFRGGGGWIVDVATGARRFFVPPPIQDIAWSPDGSEVAFLTWSGPLGSVRRDERIEVRSTDAGRVLRTVALPDESVATAVTWVPDGLVVIVLRELPKNGREAEIEIVDPRTGAWRPTGFRFGGWSMSLFAQEDGRRVFARKLVDDNTPVGSDTPRGYRLYPIDALAARVGPAIADAAGNELSFAGWGGTLSPGGRFARIVGRGVTWSAPRLADLPGGTDVADDGVPPWADWIADDRRAFPLTHDHRTRMFVAPPGGAPRVVREWANAAVRLVGAPGGRVLFVSVLPEIAGFVNEGVRSVPDPALFAGDAPKGDVPEELLYLVDEDRFVSLGHPFSGRSNDLRYTQWAGPKTIARIAPGVVCFEDIDAPGKRRFVIGGPGDLE